MRKSYILDLEDGEYVTIYKIGNIECGELPIDYRYTGDRDIKEVVKLMEKRINEILEKSIFGELNDR